MAEVIFTRGLPGSGKSTWAREQTGYKIVSRDAIRHMLGDYYEFTPDREAIVTVTCAAALKACLDLGLSVIVDETHTSARSIRDTVVRLRPLHPTYRVQDFTNVPFNVCVERVLERELAGGIHIPIEVMERMQRSLTQAPWTLTDIVKGYS